ncbi:MAG: methyl-accepting chemotaxis protein [Deltaproteobacteria bacterium]|nr:methyl-accepting chemotaxis protein [Deltaproteobacteria bacterium]
MQIEILESSFGLLAPRGSELVARFYERLFEQYPEVKPMFRHVDMAKQEKALLGALALVIKSLRSPDVLIPTLKQLGKKHEGYGTKPEHYDAVRLTLIEVMKEMAGRAFTPKIARAWDEALQTIADVMTGTTATERGNTMKKTKVGGDEMVSAEVPAGSVQADQDKLRMRAIGGVSTAIMMIDRDLVINYANRATVDLIRKNEAEFKSVYPSFNVDGLIGTCIDIFHARPEHQRRMLSDERNLPHRADIRVGKLIFQINVTAIIDDAGHYVGNTLEWYDVTAIRAKENDVARLQNAVEGVTTAIMMIDRDFVITYVNEATRQLLARRESEIRKVFPKFSAATILGSNIDIFHKHPEHQRRMLSDPSVLPHSADIKLGTLTFQIKVSAIKDAAGKYVGNTMEWSDVTEQRDAERQIESLITSATAGRLDDRMDADRYEGFVKKVGLGVNSVMNAVVVPVREAIRVIEALAQGDLTASMAGDFSGEFATLRDQLNASMNTLKNTVLRITQSAQTINSAAMDISEGNANLNKRTQEQSSALEETAASLEEMTATVKQNAGNAMQANQLASGARDSAEKGGQVVNSAVSAMSAITEASKRVADIIGVIEQIAFQTNMLALNAAVEAARAGDQGRGFAVVAAEVRNLAQRSAGAAKEIKSLIQDSQEKVEQGAKLVNRSGETLQEIVGSVNKVSDIIGEINAASEEQASGIDQINSAVTSMDKGTQQNAAMVEEAAAAAESLSDQAREMSNLVSFFKVGDEPQEASVTAAAPARRGTAAVVSSNGRPRVVGTQTMSPATASRPRETSVATRPATNGSPSKTNGNDGGWNEF